MIEVACLGPLAVRGAPRPDRPAQRRVLVALALDVGHLVDRATLVERLWDGCPPATAVNTLQVHVSGLRRCLGEVVVRDGAGYRLALAREAVDLVRFEHAAGTVRAHVRAGAWEDALALAESALRLWRGEPVPELGDTLAVSPRRVHLGRLRDMLDRTVARAWLELGDAPSAVVELERLADASPHDEGLWALLMLARARAGRRVAALDAFHDARRALAEVGCDPGGDLVGLQQAILAGAFASTAAPVPA